jgi:hypothetical protein
MTEAAVTDTPDALERLAATRSEVRQILRPETKHVHGSTGSFPRSVTMRALTGGGAMSALALVGVAVLATRPSIAGRLARSVPLVDLLRQLRLGSR